MRMPTLEVGGESDALVVDIYFLHLAPEICQPGTSIRLLFHRFYVIDLSFEGGTDECRRGVVAVNPRSSC